MLAVDSIIKSQSGPALLRRCLEMWIGAKWKKRPDLIWDFHQGITGPPHNLIRPKWIISTKLTFFQSVYLCGLQTIADDFGRDTLFPVGTLESGMLHVLGLWDEAREPAENPCRHKCLRVNRMGHLLQSYIFLQFSATISTEKHMHKQTWTHTFQTVTGCVTCHGELNSLQCDLQSEFCFHSPNYRHIVTSGMLVR